MASQSSNEELPTGQQRPSDTWGDVNTISFLVRQALGKLQTCTLVKVISCTNNGALSPVGFVDILPMVNQLDGLGNPTEHTTIYNVPYFRLQGGANAIIIDPEPGDIGMACFASRDISKVKNTKQQANPDSYRQYSFADALYLGGMLNAVPAQFVRFSTAGIQIHSPTQVKIDAPDVLIECQTMEVNASASMTVTTPTFTVNGHSVLHGAVDQTGGAGVTISGAVAAASSVAVSGALTGQGTNVHTHTHSGVMPGGGNTGPPV